MSDMPTAYVVARKRPLARPKMKPHPTIEYVQVECPFCGKKHVHTAEPDVAASGVRLSHCDYTYEGRRGHYKLRERP